MNKKQFIPDSLPVWFPDEEFIKTTNIWKSMNQLGFKDYVTFHQWSTAHYPEFWQMITTKLNIVFDKPYSKVVDLSKGIEFPYWFPDSKLNIANSCFHANEAAIAIIEQTSEGVLKKTTYGELNKLSNRVANTIHHYLKRGDRVGISMPMSKEAIAIYLGIIKAGCCVVSIAESFAAPEIASRLRIANVKIIFTQDQIIHQNKHIPLYEKIIDANAPFTIVLPAKERLAVSIRQQDMGWNDFLDKNDQLTAVSCDPEEETNILFSSGTTGEPKAIPWTHITPIKCGSDAYFHLNIQSDDILCCPTSLGWMMGSWLMYATFFNQATMAIYDGSYNNREFGQFIQNNEITILAITPSLVKNWRQSKCMEGLDWHAIKLFCSTGECSHANDVEYLSSLAHHRPVIEYCGGTEIGGAYITSTLIQPLAPATFTTPALGIDFAIIDEQGRISDNGEVALIPPSIGLSTKLLNKNHHEIYYAHMPRLSSGKILRRHGDYVEQCANGFYRIHGRVDDTMNLNGIKISSAEIESVLNTIPYISEVAAVAIQPVNGGPSQLIIYAVPKLTETFDVNQLKKDMQNAIKHDLNPLFKIHDVVMVECLPRTVSNKVMRRILREQYEPTPSRKKIIKNKAKKKICLALQGGGAYGAYTWGILDKFLENEQLEIDAISATSAGSVNAIVLAQGMQQGGHQGARNALRDFWRTLSSYGAYYSPIRSFWSGNSGTFLANDMFAQSSFLWFDFFIRNFSPYILNPLNFNLLRLVLSDRIDFKKLHRHNKIKLFLCATNVKTGMLKIFENSEITLDTIIASACLPNLFQAVEIDGEYYWDGGFLGNPPIFPLIYHSKVNDIVIIHNNPIIRDTVPISSTDITNRINEISFNSSLLRELRVIAFISKIIDKGWIKEEYQEMMKKRYIHIIRSDEIMNQFTLINKYNWCWDFISHLYDLGRITADNWLKINFDHLGRKPTIDFYEFLGDDTQTSE